MKAVTFTDMWDQIIQYLLSSLCLRPLTANLKSISNVCRCINHEPTRPSACPYAVAPPSVPIVTWPTQTARLPHRRPPPAPMGSRPSRSSIISLNMQRAEAFPPPGPADGRFIKSPHLKSRSAACQESQRHMATSEISWSRLDRFLSCDSRRFICPEIALAHSGNL